MSVKNGETQNKFSIDKTGYYIVTFENADFTIPIKYKAYELYNSTEIPVIQGKDEYNCYLFKAGQELILRLYGMPNQQYNVTVAHTPDGYIAPQEIKFGSTEKDDKQHYIFDDNPEHIRNTDLLDSPTPRALMHAHNLQAGHTYTIFSYHHQDIVGDDGINVPVFFDAVFKTITNPARIKVNRAGYSSAYEIKNGWNDIQIAWSEFESSPPISNKYKNMSNIAITSQNDSKWLSDYLINYSTQVSKTDIGYTFLIMEFTVLEGTVNFSTVAYKNKDTAKNIINTQNVVSQYVGDRPLALKGIADTAQVIEAIPMEYCIGDKLVDSEGNEVASVNLPFSLTNDVVQNARGVSEFTLNTSPLFKDARWSTPSSSVIGLKYTGKSEIKNVTVEKEREWIFDQMHVPYVDSFPLPEQAKKGVYTNKTAFEPNEEFNRDWVTLFSDSTNNMPLLDDVDVKAIITDSIFFNYGITQRFTLTLHNTGSSVKDFKYKITFKAPYIIKCSVNETEEYKEIFCDSENKNNVETIENYDEDGNLISISYILTIPVNIEPGTTTIVLETTMLAAATGTSRYEYIVSEQQP